MGNVEIITSIDRLSQVYDDYVNSTYVALDTETTGLHRFAEPVGISFARSKEDSFYIPIKTYAKDTGLTSPWTDEQLEAIKSFTADIITNTKLILHNAVFDAKIIHNWMGVDLIPHVYCDTVLLAHTVYNEEGPLGLKALAALLIDPNANAPQEEVKRSVKENGGTTTKTSFEMYKCDYKILGHYAGHDVLYTYALFEKLYPELEIQNLQELWHTEVLPLLRVAYELNTIGVTIDKDYFIKLKADVDRHLLDIEDEIYNLIQDKIGNYEYNRVLEEYTITARSALGKALIEQFQIDMETINFSDPQIKNFILEFHKAKTGKSRIFNLDSNDDKAFLLYDILELPCEKETKSGKKSTDAATLKALAPSDPTGVINKLLYRASEQKILSTYIEPILENEVNGKIYTGFNQTGTISGRFSSSQPINLQTLPKNDKRIKKGFVPESGWVLIGDDYSSLEPRAFAYVSGENAIKDIFRNNLDFYSKIAIDMFGATELSANPNDSNYVGEVAPELRQKVKAIALAIPYGAGPGRISQLLNIPYEEAKDLVDKYLNTYRKLAKWMKDSEWQAITKGYVTTLTGRKRRANLVHRLYTKYGITNFSKKTLERLFSNDDQIEGYTDYVELYLDCRNNLNNAKNVQIQGLAGSICNAAMISFYDQVRKLGLSARVVLQVHDEIIVTCPKEEASQTAKLLQYCMEKNNVAKMIDVAMIAEPIITDQSLAEAK